MSLQQILTIFLAHIRVFLATLVLTVLTTAVVTNLLPKTYTATASLIVNLKKPDVGQLNQPAYLQPYYLETQAAIISSHKVALKVVNDLKMADSPVAQAQFKEATGGRGTVQDFLAERLTKQVEAKYGHANVIDIEYSANDARFAATMANAFAQAYIDTNLELLVEPARQSSQWIASKLKQLREDLEKAQTKLSDYQRTNGVVSVDEKSDVESSRHAAFAAQLVQAQTDTLQALSRKRLAEEFVARGSPLESLPDVLTNGFILTLKSNLLTEEGKLHDSEALYGKNHPRYQRQASDVAALREKMKQEIGKVMAYLANNYKLASQREGEIRAAMNSQKGTVLAQKKEHDDQAVLLREVQNAQSAYDDALKTYRQSSIESQEVNTNVALLNPALEPMSPSRPKVAKNILLSVAIGFILGAAGVLLLELLDRRVRTADDLVQAFDLPLLAALQLGDEKNTWWRRLRRLWLRRGLAAA